jgi:hypothetical protein
MTGNSRWGQYVAKLSIFLISIALIAGMAGCDGYTPSKDLEIRDWYDLDAVRDNVAGNHILMNDLDSATAGYNELASPTANGGKGWQPIGDEFSLFAGSFDGQGHEIVDLFIDRPDGHYVGLFSTVDEEGVIENVGVVNANVTGEYGVGGLAGFNGGTVSNSYSTASVTGEEYVGGLAGDSTGTMSNCYFIGSVTGYEDVGGLMGYNNGPVSNSFYNYDEVLINGENIITVGALLPDDFNEWLANDKFLNVNERLSQEDGYYVVNNISDFKELLAFGQNATLKFRLKNDLDLAAEPGLYIPYLAGEFDGNGHEISNLSFDFDFVSNVGLFGYIASSGKVIGVGVDNINVTGTSFVGGLAGYSAGIVSNSHAIGSVTGDVSGTGNKQCFGGLVGCNAKGTVSNCYAAANVTGDLWAGGLMGLNKEGAVSNSYSTGSVNGNLNVGGLVGENYGTVSNSYSTADVTGEYGVGGLAGGNYGAVGVPGLAVEGFISSLSNSYSTGNVTGNEEVGGLVGLNDGGTVSNCYSTGSVSGNEDVGGLAGRNYGTVHDSFWDIETSGQATSDGGTGRTTAQMKSITTFSSAGWNVIAVGGSDERDPAYIWNIANVVTYPFLSWQPV